MKNEKILRDGGIIAAAIICLLSSLFASIAHGEPSLNSQYSRDQKANSERGIRRERNIEVKHDKSKSRQRGGEASSKNERQKEQHSSRESRHETSQRVESQINVDWPQLASVVISRIERGKIGYGVVASALRNEPVLTRPCVPRVSGTWTNEYSANCTSISGKPNAYAKYRNIRTNRGLMPKLIASYYGRMLLTRRALDDLSRGGGRVVLRDNENPLTALQTAIMGHLGDRDLIDAAWQKGVEMASDGCRIPTDVAVANDGVTDYQCGALKVEPLGGTATFAGSHWTGGSDVGGIKYTASISRSVGSTFARADGTSTRRTASTSDSTFRRHSVNQTGGISTTMRRGRTLGRTGTAGTGASMQAGVTAKPQN